MDGYRRQSRAAWRELPLLTVEQEAWGIAAL